MPAGVPLAGAPGTREPDPELHWINRDGFVALERDSSGVPLVPQLPGNRMWARAAGDRDSAPAYVAIAGGALVGRPGAYQLQLTFFVNRQRSALTRVPAQRALLS